MLVTKLVIEVTKTGKYNPYHQELHGLVRN